MPSCGSWLRSRKCSSGSAREAENLNVSLELKSFELNSTSWTLALGHVAENLSTMHVTFTAVETTFALHDLSTSTVQHTRTFMHTHVHPMYTPTTLHSSTNILTRLHPHIHFHDTATAPHLLAHINPLACIQTHRAPYPFNFPPA